MKIIKQGRNQARMLKCQARPQAQAQEKGLYMLATILKSTQAIQTTIAVIETFAKIRHLSRNMKELSTVQDEADQKILMRKSGQIIAEILDDDLETTDTKTTIELNFALLKFKHTIKKKK